MQTTLEHPEVAQAGDLRAYQGGFFRILVAPAQSQNAFALFEITIPRGAEPPRHLHTREDETFYILEGEITFHIGEETGVAGAGETVFAPRNVAHSFTLNTPAARLLVLLTPGHFMGHFLDHSQPLAAPVPLTPPQGPPPAEVIQAMVQACKEKYGVLFT